MILFHVIDKETGEEPDLRGIEQENPAWIQGLYDLEGWAILPDGQLILLDASGNYVYAPEPRFEVVMEEKE